ncbi:ANGL2 protein, partial [Atractosteus spatula]|nr:ANGL2 protein [Atractosteus spatula]
MTCSFLSLCHTYLQSRARRSEQALPHCHHPPVSAGVCVPPQGRTGSAFPLDIHTAQQLLQDSSPELWKRHFRHGPHVRDNVTKNGQQNQNWDSIVDAHTPSSSRAAGSTHDTVLIVAMRRSPHSGCRAAAGLALGRTAGGGGAFAREVAPRTEGGLRFLFDQQDASDRAAEVLRGLHCSAPHSWSELGSPLATLCLVSRDSRSRDARARRGSDVDERSLSCCALPGQRVRSSPWGTSRGLISTNTGPNQQTAIREPLPPGQALTRMLTQARTRAMRLPAVVILVLLWTDSGAQAGQTQEFETSEDGDLLYTRRHKRAPASEPEPQDKCSYTFIVPQQKVTGAICVNSKEPDAVLENRVNKQELELLNSELLKQKRQIETLQQLVEVDGGIVNEVKLLRKESRNMNSRVTQLYMQLLHEIIRKRDNALELSQLENKILNQTSEMLQLTNRYKDLEHKYQHLASLANNQSILIAQLEEHCQRMPITIRPIPQPPPSQPNKHYQPPTYTRITNQITNEIQGDQNLKALPPPLPTMPSVTHSPSTTNKPSVLLDHGQERRGSVQGNSASPPPTAHRQAEGRVCSPCGQQSHAQRNPLHPTLPYKDKYIVNKSSLAPYRPDSDCQFGRSAGGLRMLPPSCPWQCHSLFPHHSLIRPEGRGEAALLTAMAISRMPSSTQPAACLKRHSLDSNRHPLDFTSLRRERALTLLGTRPWKDCLQALEDGHDTSGMYLVKPENANRLMQVWCDQRHDPGGWTVIQRRQDGSVNFFRNWEIYKQGFGNIDGEYWLGLENIYWLTNQGNYKLLVTLEDWSGRKVFAEYASFRVESEAEYYKLRVGRYHGNAGDSLTWHNGKQFTTLDRDHDVYTGNCAHYQKGGWWYNACAHSNLNGVWYRGGHYRSRYQDGVYWAEFRGGAYSLKKVVMMIRPNPNTFH